MAPGGVSQAGVLMSDESIGNNTDHWTPHTVSNSSMLEVNLAQVKVPVRLFVKEGCARILKTKPVTIQ